MVSRKILEELKTNVAEEYGKDPKIMKSASQKTSIKINYRQIQDDTKETEIRLGRAYAVIFDEVMKNWKTNNIVTEKCLVQKNKDSG